jgi:hypothetical protein
MADETSIRTTFTEEEKMPCYTVNLVSVEFKAENKELLVKALKQMGASYSYDENFDANRISVFSAAGGWMHLFLDGRPSRIDATATKALNQLKRKYSEVVVLEAARAKRFAIRKLSENKLLAVR